MCRVMVYGDTESFDNFLECLDEHEAHGHTLLATVTLSAPWMAAEKTRLTETRKKPIGYDSV